MGRSPTSFEVVVNGPEKLSPQAESPRLWPLVQELNGKGYSLSVFETEGRRSYLLYSPACGPPAPPEEIEERLLRTRLDEVIRADDVAHENLTEFRMWGADAPWGNMTYGSTNKAYQGVVWSKMADAGCGPTSLATVIHYLYLRDGKTPPKPITPAVTMNFAEEHGRGADLFYEMTEARNPDDSVIKGPDGKPKMVRKKDANGHWIPEQREIKQDGKNVMSAGSPQGTNLDDFIAHLSEAWPGYSGFRLDPKNMVDNAVFLLDKKKVLLFNALHNPTWNYKRNPATQQFLLDAKGELIREEQNWPVGHIMVVFGHEWGLADDEQIFWISDPSGAKTKYTNRRTLRQSNMWYIDRDEEVEKYRKDMAFKPAGK